MGAYLVDNPPRVRQYRRPRRAQPSGVIVVHTAESLPDETGPDTGAENVARFIRDRTNYGSYHDLADSDSLINLVPYDAEAYHDGTGSNPHSYGVSAATQAHEWKSLPGGWVDATVDNMARAAARYATWLKVNHGIKIPARRINRAQSEKRVPGFLSHAERDPRRRTDPGADFPWAQFLNRFEDHYLGEDDMPTADEIARAVWAWDAREYWDEDGNRVRDRRSASDMLWSTHRASLGGTWNVRVRRGGEMVPAIQELADAKTAALKANVTLAALVGLLGDQQDSGEGLTLEQVRQAVKDAVEDAFAQQLPVTVVDEDASASKAASSTVESSG